MRRLFLVLALIIPTFAAAQSQEDEDKSYIAQLIEDNLSGDTRKVNIIGFEGALSSAASIRQLTVADSEGVWLTLDDVVLTWNRSALLRGAIDVQELSAAKITVARAPIPDTSIDLPAAEATPFALPDLPVSISLEELSIAEIALGDVFLGEPVTLSLTGTAALSGGAGSANVQAIRLDTRAGTFQIDGAYDNTTQDLSLVLDLAEDPDGIIARLLNLPGKPSVEMTVNGTGPITDYAADLTVATNGQNRLTGGLTLTATDAGQQFALDVGGDVTPLFAPDYQDFFGPDVRLAVTGIAPAQGGLDLSALEISAQNIAVSGQLRTDASGWPERIALTGQIRTRDGAPVLLPLAGTRTLVDAVDLDIDYDRQQSDDWRATFDIANLARPGLAIASTRLNAAGTILAGDSPAVTANLTYGASGLVMDDIGMAEALGEEIAGNMRVVYQDGTPTRISELTLSGPGISLAADATIGGPDIGLRTQSNVALSVASLERFATLVGQDLSGAAQLDITSTISPLDGFFEILLSGTTQNLKVGIDQIDPVIAGTGDISLLAERDTTGTRLRDLRIATPTAEITADANIRSDATDATFAMNLTDVGLVVEGINGPADVSGTVRQPPGGALAFDIIATAPAARLSARGTLTDSTDLRADITLNAQNIGAYRDVIGQDVSGGVSLSADVNAQTDGSTFDVTLAGQTTNLQSGIAQLDPLLRGQGNIAANVQRTGPDRFVVQDLRVTTPSTRITGQADGNPAGALQATAQLAINNAGLIAPGLSGPMAVDLTANRNAAGATKVDLAATAPGTDITVDATVSADNLIAGNVRANVDELRPYQRLTGQPLRGGLNAIVVGTLQADLSAFNTEITVRTRDIGIGNPNVDQLLRGAGSLTANVAQTDAGLNIRNLRVETSNVSLSANLNGTTAGGSGQFDARLRDVGLFTDQLSGPVTASGTATRRGTSWGVNVDATGPGGIGAQVTGSASDSGTLDLRMTGNAPLGLANDIIAPRRLSGDATFALNVSGPPQLSSVTGRINVANGRLAAPTLSQALEDINGAISLTGNQATLDVTANVERGGRLAITGPVGLAAPNNADVTVTLSDIILKDPTLYDSSIAGSIGINGPLAGGARIAGTLALGPTEIQVPSSSVSTLGELPTIVHLGESAAVRQTLNRADVNEDVGNANARTSTGPIFPLDITINAPSRVFIRGRGLDAELGGTLNLGGTTGNVLPVGRFDLVRGRIDILQQRFELTEGSASLQGDFEPFIRLVAATEARTGTVISIIVEGPASEPDVTFASVPELPQDEVLAQLIFGRNLSEISPLQAIQLAAAVGTLAGRGGGGLIDGFRQDLGLDDLDVTTDDNGNAAVRAGTYISENVYTDVTVSSDGSTEVNINLDITDEITAKGTAAADGETSIGIFFERDY